MNQEQMTQLADDAANEAVRHIQDKLGIESGDFAGLYFSGNKWEVLLQVLVGYICAEIIEGNTK